MFSTTVREQASAQPVRRLVQAVRACPRTQTSSRCSRRSYASETDNGKSFKGQLYDSTHQRLIRERAEQARFAAIREGRKGGGAPAWVTPLGMYALLCRYGQCHAEKLTQLYSPRSWSLGRISAGQTNTSRPGLDINTTTRRMSATTPQQRANESASSVGRFQGHCWRGEHLDRADGSRGPLGLGMEHTPYTRGRPAVRDSQAWQHRGCEQDHEGVSRTTDTGDCILGRHESGGTFRSDETGRVH